MSTRTRYFVIASLLVMFVGVGTGLVAYYTGFAGNLARQGGVDDLKFLPQDSQLVAFANVRGVMDSALRQKMRQVLPIPGDGQRQILEQTGINIETDVDSVLACLTAARAGDRAPVSPLILARGTFDASRIEGFMRQHGATVEDYKGARLIVTPNRPADPNLILPPAPSQPDSFTVSFLEPGLAALGTRSLVQVAVDQKVGGAGLPTNAEMMSRVQSLASGDLWAVGRFDALVAHAPLPPGLKQQIPAITWFSATANVDSGIHGTLLADASDPKAAEDLREVLRGFMALGRLQAGSYPQVKTLMDSLQLGGSGTTVSLGFEVPGELIDLLHGAPATSQPSQRLPLNPGK